MIPTTPGYSGATPERPTIYQLRFGARAVLETDYVKLEKQRDAALARVKELERDLLQINPDRIEEQRDEARAERDTAQAALEVMREALEWAKIRIEYRITKSEQLGGDLGTVEKIKQALATTPAEALKELAELREDRARLDVIDALMEGYGTEGILEGNRWIIDGPFRDIRHAADVIKKDAAKKGAE